MKYGEPGAVVYLAECVKVICLTLPSCVDTIFAEAHYRLSGGEATLKSGRIVSVDKGEWDCSMGGVGDDYNHPA
jgi:site-specific DNA-methyltransferase (adenine-specific)